MNFQFQVQYLDSTVVACYNSITRLTTTVEQGQIHTPVTIARHERVCGFGFRDYSSIMRNELADLLWLDDASGGGPRAQRAAHRGVRAGALPRTEELLGLLGPQRWSVPNILQCARGVVYERGHAGSHRDQPGVGPEYKRLLGEAPREPLGS